MRPTYHRLIAVPAALLALLLGAPATAAPAGQTLVIRGGGDGHGVGMSQWGALGDAEHGASAAAILAHFYSGTAIGRIPASVPVRVLLQGNVSSAAFSDATRAVVGHAQLRLHSTGAYRVRLSGIQVRLMDGSGRTVLSGPPPLRVTGSTPPRLLGGAAGNVRDGRFRGALFFAPAAHGGMNVVDRLRVEDYVRGVVAAEMSPSWAPAALEAQAIASRTYVLTSHDGPSAGGFDVYGDTRSQAYRGVAGETPSTDAAVAATAGEVVTYAGRPVLTFFFDSSGGHTENVENAFSGAAPDPWLRGVPDPYDGGPLHAWTRRLSLADAQSRLGGLVQGTLEGIEVTRRGASPRILSAETLGSAGRTQVSGDTLAARLSLPDTWAVFSLLGADGRESPEPDSSGSTGAGTGAAIAATAAGSTGGTAAASSP